MKFSKGFFDLEEADKFKLWHKKAPIATPAEDLVLL